MTRMGTDERENRKTLRFVFCFSLIAAYRIPDSRQPLGLILPGCGKRGFGPNFPSFSSFVFTTVDFAACFTV